MDRNDGARPGVATGTGGEEVGETTATVTQPSVSVTPLGGSRGGDPVVSHRRDVRALDEHLADDAAAGYVFTAADVLALLTPPRQVSGGPPCGGVHTGPCDRWAACTGMALTVVERGAAGAVHPWRLVA